MTLTDMSAVRLASREFTVGEPLRTLALRLLVLLFTSTDGRPLSLDAPPAAA